MNLLVDILLGAGGFFCLVAALGVWRFRDFYSRVHAATKASTFGLGFTIMAAAVELGTLSALAKAVLALVFLFMTLPVSAHLLARAYRSWEKSGNGQPTEEGNKP